MKYVMLVLALVSGLLMGSEPFTPVSKGALEMKQVVDGKHRLVSGQVVDQDESTYKVLRFHQGTKPIYQTIKKEDVKEVLPDYVFPSKLIPASEESKIHEQEIIEALKREKELLLKIKELQEKTK